MKKDVNTAYKEYKQEKQNMVNNGINKFKIIKAKKVYPITKILLAIMHLFNNEKIRIISNNKINNPENRTVIYANTHRFKPDFEKITLITKSPSFVVASDFKNSYGDISGWYFGTRPTVFVDPYSKEDKKLSYDLMKKYIESGLNCTIFPEAVWNLSPNRIMLDTFFGTVKLALETNSLIVCTGIERYDKTYIVNRSKELDMNLILKKYTEKKFVDLDSVADKELIKNILIECNQVMRDTMATLLYDIWDYYHSKNGLVIRSELDDNYWNNYIDSLTSEWPGYEMRANIEEQFQNPDFIEQYQVEQDLQGLKQGRK